MTLLNAFTLRFLLGLISIFLLAAPVQAQLPPVYVLEWGGFSDPVAIDASQAGNIFILDGGCQCVKKFDGDGQPLAQWGSAGTASGQFVDAADLTVDGKERVYVVDRGLERIQVFSSQGDFLGMWGQAGSENGEFENARSVDVDGDGVIYVLDGQDVRVQKFQQDGTFVSSWLPNLAPGGSSPFSVSQRIGLAPIVPTFITYIGANGSGVLRVDHDGGLMGAVLAPELGTPPFLEAFGVDANGTGSAFITDIGYHRVAQVDLQGKIIASWGSQGNGACPSSTK